MATIKSIEEVLSIINKLGLTGVYLFIGNGANLQYKDMNQVKDGLKPLLAQIEWQHGTGGWLAVYGGDTWVEEKPDLGACMHWIKEVYKPTVLAVQGWEERDQFVDYVYRYEEETDETGRLLYGGVRNGRLIGGSKVYLGNQFRDLLTGVVDIDSKGRVGTQELEYAKRLGLNIMKVSLAEARYSY